jgi:hypothetical protein
MTKQYTHLYDNYLIKSANSILHDPFREFIINNDLFDPILTNKISVDVQDEFLELYPEWIKSSNLNKFKGIDKFPFKYVSLGVTQAIDDFVIWTLKQNKRLRVFRGEYGYVGQISFTDLNPRIDDTSLKIGDAVLISCPFSATGNIHAKWDNLMDTCNSLNIPVFVDCAFFGTCTDIEVDFNHPCIDTVAFSPTKGLNCGNMRTGMTMTMRSGKDCILDILKEWHHGIHLHTYIAYNLMKNFSPDTIPLTYRDIQQTVCDHYGLIPTNTIHLALGDDTWNYFNRENVVNRVCLRNAIYDYANVGSLK